MLLLRVFRLVSAGPFGSRRLHLAWLTMKAAGLLTIILAEFGDFAMVMPEPRSESVHRPPRSRVIMPGLVAAEGAALAVLAGLDGTPVWQVVRVLVVIAAAVVGVWVTAPGRPAGRG